MSSATRRRRPLPHLLLLPLLAVALTACGSSASTPTVAPSPLPAATATETAPLASATATATASPTPAPTPVPSPTPASVATVGPKVEISLKAVVGGLTSPIGISTAPGDPRLFVIGQAGQVFIVSGGKITGTFLNIAGRISCCGERGLLGLAFHPNYATNGRFFVRYTDKSGNVQISEFHVSADPAKADPSTEKRLVTIPHPSFANHNGGRIEFGLAGFLYIGTGDGGSGGDPNDHGQALNTLLGKLLRIDVDHPASGKPYGIPADNPFVGHAGALPEIYAFGLRNPYSFSFDRETGDLWIGDVGQDKYEEIDRATVADGRGNGANFGWSVMEANHCYKPSSDCVREGLTLPIAEYFHGAGDATGCAVIGGYVYRGSVHPELVGRYFFGDECSGLIWDVTAAGPNPQTPQMLLSSSLNIDGWGQGSDGELYLVAANGTLYQLQ